MVYGGNAEELPLCLRRGLNVVVDIYPSGLELGQPDQSLLRVTTLNNGRPQWT
jgi:hypothetical protein